MPKSFNEILGTDMLAENAKIELQEAYEARIAEQREQVTAELREEFASRYTKDKAQIVEAMDAMLTSVIKTELDGFAVDRAAVVKERINYKKNIRKHAELLESFINSVLASELNELRNDRIAQKTNFEQLEEFVLNQLTTELSEFSRDKKALAAQQVKMVSEGKHNLKMLQSVFVKESAKKVSYVIEQALRGELHTLREDIQIAKENTFGRQIFESFASEFMTNTLNESTQTAKLASQVVRLKQKVAESVAKSSATSAKLAEAKQQVRIVSEQSTRKAAMQEMLSPLTRAQQEVMGTLLETVITPKLSAAYKKFLPAVLSESNTTQRKARLTENVNVVKPKMQEITGNKHYQHSQTETGTAANIIELKKLAGLS